MEKISTAMTPAEKMRRFRKRKAKRIENLEAQAQAAGDLCAVLRYVASMGNAQAQSVVSSDDVETVVKLSANFLDSVSKQQDEIQKTTTKKR
jgi:succinyl-CoA synthetase beta subunit